MKVITAMDISVTYYHEVIGLLLLYIISCDFHSKGRNISNHISGFLTTQSLSELLGLQRLKNY